MEKIHEKCYPINFRFLVTSVNVLIFSILIGWYTFEHSSPYKENLATLFVKYFHPDHCIIKPWSETEYDLDNWRHKDKFMDVCLLPEFIDKNKVTLYGLKQFLQIQFHDKSNPMYKKLLISSTIYGTNFNGVLLDGTLMLYHPKEIYTNSTSSVDCVNMEFDGSIKKFTTRRPFRISFINTYFQKEEMDFYGAMACFLADYFDNDDNDYM